MDCAARKKAIMEAKNFSDVETVVQEAKISRSGVELLRTAYQIQEKQPNIASHFKSTVIREMEEKDEKKEQEYVGGEGHGVGGTNRADPIPMEGKSTDSGEKPDTGFQNPEDQMREDIMPGLHPDIARMMQGSMNNIPPMNAPQQIKQMQYTVKRMVAPLIKEIENLKGENKQLREAYSALDKKLTETVNQKGSMRLEIGKNGVSPVKETIGETPSIDSVVKHESLEDRRFKISELNRMLNDGPQESIYG